MACLLVYASEKQSYMVKYIKKNLQKLLSVFITFILKLLYLKLIQQKRRKK
tara:strand:- start:45137 stop:45289 length:153 start_codon:yes stop_codon:yes gene_type:complete